MYKLNYVYKGVPPKNQWSVLNLEKEVLLLRIAKIFSHIQSVLFSLKAPNLIFKMEHPVYYCIFCFLDEF